MSESNQGVDRPKLPNKISEYVLSKVDRYEKLNAPTLIEGDEKFRSVLVSTLGTSKDGKQIGFGGNFNVFQLKDAEHVAVKRLEIPNLQAGVDVDSYWQSLIDDHKTAEKYFGRRFIPHTEFIVLNGTSGNEYVMVQEKAQGDRYKDDVDLPLISPKLKAEMVELIKRYERMMREEGAVLDHVDRELMIDHQNGSATILDTNDFTALKDATEGDAKAFWENFNVDPETVKTPMDIINNLIEIIPEFQSLKGQDYVTVTNRINFRTGDLGKRAYEALLWGSIPSSITYGFEDLVMIADNISPAGYHPRVVRVLMRRFGINENDLIEDEDE